MGGFAIGGDISPINLLPGQLGSPTGTALVDQMGADGIRIIRLVAESPAAEPVLFAELHHGGWGTVFRELDAAHINAILLVGGESDTQGTRAAGDWPPEPPTPGFPRPGQVVESTAQWIANQGSILADIKAQCGGYPASLVGIEAANEPMVVPATVPLLRRDIAAIHAEAPGIPVTLGGWRVPARHSGERWDFNNAVDTPTVAPLVDFVSTHMYLNNLPVLPNGYGDITGTDPAVYAAAASAFLAQVIAGANGKPVFVGEFGGLDGRTDAAAGTPPGGSLAHQAAVIQATITAIEADRSLGVTGGSVWLLEQNAGSGFTCTAWALLCFGQAPTPALAVLSAGARVGS